MYHSGVRTTETVQESTDDAVVYSSSRNSESHVFWLFAQLSVFLNLLSQSTYSILH